MERAEQFRYKWWSLFGVSLLAFTAFLDATIVNTALPFIQADLHIDILQLQWVTNIFIIILSMTMIAIGKFADLWGRKKIFYIGSTLFGIAAVGAALSPSIDFLLFFRGMQALGASTVFIASAALLSDVFPVKERVQAISIYGGITGFGLMIGPFLGGVLINLLNWRWIFWINIPLIGVGLLACVFSLRSHIQDKHPVKIDYTGLILLISGLGALMYGIIAGAEANWSSIYAWIFLALGFCGITLLLILDSFRKNPLLDLAIFKEKLLSLATLSCALAGIASTVFMFFDPLYLRILRNMPAFEIGLLIAVIPAAQALIACIFNQCVKRFGVSNLLFFSVITAFFAISLHRMIGADTPILFLVLPFFLLGVNWGLSNSAMITAVNEVVAPQKIGAAIGTIATIWNLVGAIFLALSTVIFHAVEIHSAFLAGFHRAIEFNILFATLVLAIAIWIRLHLKKKTKNRI